MQTGNLRFPTSNGMNLLATFVERNLLSASDRLEVEASVGNGASLKEALEGHGVALLDALSSVAESYGISARLLPDPPVDQDVLRYIPLESAKHYGFVPLAEVDGALEVGIVDPDNIEAMDALHFISGKLGVPYKVFLITKEDFDRVLETYQNLSGEVGKALSEYETASVPTSKRGPAESGSPSLTEEGPLDLAGRSEALKEDAPVTKIVSTILRYAIEGKASDVHVEPSPTKTRVRFRMDGTLHTSLELPAKVHEAVVARIKILSQLRLDEKRKPQDGRFSATVEKRRIDFRVSTFPTDFGEKVVMRILDQSQSTATLETVGLTEGNLATVRDLLRAPYGIVLISGPTGSGKSTTLFAMLSEVDRESLNVVSLEDPIEYQISGVSQSQVRPEIGYTFASGLRSILRQDPDVIMVGEIRDKETAALAVQAALTGHLVFSTIHTNTAAGAISRLVDMGVDPYLIAPTLVAVIGQRLVRRLCEGAGKPIPMKESIRALLERQFADLPDQYRKKLPPFKQFYKATPTADCPNGTRGRLGVFEILRVTDALEKTILENPVEEKVYQTARSEGMLTMREDAIVRALRGEIPFEEINTLGGELLSEDRT